MSPPPPQIMLFDLREVIEIIFHDRFLERSKVRGRIAGLEPKVSPLQSGL
jgi:hypothetical protein